MCGPYRVWGGLRIFCNNKFGVLYRSPRIVRIIESMRLVWVCRPKLGGKNKECTGIFVMELFSISLSWNTEEIGG
jgi:hypothetical protein